MKAELAVALSAGFQAIFMWRWELARMPVALRESGSALLCSRALIWAAGIYTALIAGPARPAANSFNHHQLTTPFHSFWIALAQWATQRRRTWAVIGVCAPFVALWSALFVSWTWAA
jgi:hypothetical protein